MRQTDLSAAHPRPASAAGATGGSSASAAERAALAASCQWHPVSRQILFAFLTLCLLTAGVLAADDRKPVPDPVQQKEAEKKIKELYKNEYATRTVAERKAFAVKLVGQGLASRSDERMQYVLFREGMTIATQLGEVDIADSAVTEMAKIFAVERIGAKQAAFDKAAAAVSSKEGVLALFKAYMKLVSEAIADDNYDGAAKAATAAENAARRAQDVALLSEATGKAKAIKEMAADFVAIKAAQKTLEDSPTDANANLVIGKHFLKKEDLKSALPYLAKGSDLGLKTVAEKELAKPLDVAVQLQLADDWWNVGETLSGKYKIEAQYRASRWYRFLGQKIAEDRRGVIAERVLAVGMARRGDKPPAVTATQKNRDTKGVEIGGKEANCFAKFTLEFWVKTKETTGVLLTKRALPTDASITITIDSGQPYLIGEGPDYNMMIFTAAKVNNGEWHHIAAVKTDKEIVLFVDGKKSGKMPIAEKFISASPWRLGYHEPQTKGALDAEFKMIRISNVPRYAEDFAPTQDYIEDFDTSLFK